MTYRQKHRDTDIYKDKKTTERKAMKLDIKDVKTG